MIKIVYTWSQASEEILSTFEFTGSIEENSFTNYTNTEYSYSINYPTNWKTTNVAAGNTALSALPNSRAIDITSDNVEDGMFSIQHLQLMPTLPEGFTQSQETIGTNTFTVRTSNVHNMLSKTYYTNTPDGVLEILIRPITSDNEKIFEEMLKSLKIE